MSPENADSMLDVSPVPSWLEIAPMQRGHRQGIIVW